jgi:hypothetical protein
MPNLFASRHPRLGHAASVIGLEHPSKIDAQAAGCVLEPRPTKIDDEDEYDKRRRSGALPS